MNPVYDDSEEIIKLIATRNHLLACKKSSFIDFWDIDLRKKTIIKSIDITSLAISLTSYNVGEVIASPNGSYLVMTQKG